METLKPTDAFLAGLIGAALVEAARMVRRLDRGRPPSSWPRYLAKSSLLLLMGGVVAGLEHRSLASWLLAAQLGAVAPAVITGWNSSNGRQTSGFGPQAQPQTPVSRDLGW